MEIQYLNPESKTNKPCIFKLYVKKKYVIVKTMEISPLIANLKEQLAREVRTFKEGSIFSKLVKEIVRTGHTVINWANMARYYLYVKNNSYKLCPYGNGYFD